MNQKQKAQGQPDNSARIITKGYSVGVQYTGTA